MALLDLPQIKTVLEESARTIFTDWLSKTTDPDKVLNDAAIILSKKLNEEILIKCPSVIEHKFIVLGFVTEQVDYLFKQEVFLFHVCNLQGP